ncbi:Hsp20/alpha crystallin family protein [Tenacibaculum geojense]|uniref:Hsp20/alpha crystallin family protein n=1 Tax=Tenacibaculum geojense TaxID=915352 RepID=A0ABW3JRF2_9FLAO
MSNLVSTSSNGSLTKRKEQTNFPNFSSLLDDFFTNDLSNIINTSIHKVHTPMVNILENDESYVVEMAAPGKQKSDFEIDLNDNVLSISSELKKETESNNFNYARKEFEFTSFKRSFTLPDTVDDSKIKANYTNGLLTITLPKKEEAKKKPPRRIDIS